MLGEHPAPDDKHHGLLAVHILRATLAAFYVTALAFVAGMITGHVVIARQPGNFEPSNESLVVALLQFAGLVIVGLILGTRRMRGGARAANMLPSEYSHQRRADASEVRERSADRGIADVADRRAEGTAPVSVPPAVNSVTTKHVAGVVEPGVVDSRARAVERPRDTPRVDATNRAKDRPARAQRVEPPSKPAPAPGLADPRIISGESREGVARAWIGGGALIVVGGVGFALGGAVQFGRPFAALLAVLGFALVARAVTVTVARRRIGKTWVQLRTSPIAPGSELEGLIWSSNRRLRRAVRNRTPMRPARVRLLCRRGPAPTRRGTSMTNSALVWQKEVAVRSDRMTVSTGHLGVPFRFDVPADVPEMSRPGDAHPIVWLLSVEMVTDAVALAEQFELPIYAGPNSLGHVGTISDRG